MKRTTKQSGKKAPVTFGWRNGEVRPTQYVQPMQELIDTGRA